MKRVRWLGIVSLVGGGTAVPLLIAFYMIEWGAVGTAAYQRYELLNRLMAVALLFMAAGWLGVGQVMKGYDRWAALIAFIGVLIMAGGTAAEFWLFSDLSYTDQNLRQAAFTAFGIGGALLDIGAMVIGIGLWQKKSWPRWSTIILLMALFIDLAAFIWLNAAFMAVAILSLTISYNLLTIKDVPDTIGTAAP